ncbi:MAG: hypothetical protein AB1847_04760 [bacterium]
MPKNCNDISAPTLARIKRQLTESRVLLKICTLLEEMDLSGYLIGGTIRDLVLDRPVKDIDIAINTNPEYFLKRLSRKVAGHSICLDRKFFTFRFMPKGQSLIFEQGQKGQASEQCRTKRGQQTQDQHQTENQHQGENQHQYWFDFTPLKGDSIAMDLLKRDFTINAMAIDLEDLLTPDAPLRLIDPLGGIRDLAKRTIRAISEEALSTDPLRILRAYRLAGQLEFGIEEKTRQLIHRDGNLVKNTAPERIREELFLVLSLGKSSSTFRLLQQNGLFPILFSPDLPELPQRESSPDVPATAWSAALHTLTVAEEVLSNLPIGDPDCLRTIQDMLSQTAGHQTTYRSLLKLAAFLSALPQVWTQGRAPARTQGQQAGENQPGVNQAEVNQAGMKQKGEKQQGVKQTGKNVNWFDSFMRWLCLSTPQRKYATACIQGMQRAFEMIRNCHCTPRYFYRFFRDYGEAGIGALILSMAHLKAAREAAAGGAGGWPIPPPDMVSDMMSVLNAWYAPDALTGPDALTEPDALATALDALTDLFTQMIRFYHDWQKSRQKPLVDGKFLLDHFHLSPGPVIGDILNLLEEARAEGEIQTREEAIELARRFFQAADGSIHACPKL